MKKTIRFIILAMVIVQFVRCQTDKPSPAATEARKQHHNERVQSAVKAAKATLKLLQNVDKEINELKEDIKFHESVKVDAAALFINNNVSLESNDVRLQYYRDEIEKLTPYRDTSFVNFVMEISPLGIAVFVIFIVVLFVRFCGSGSWVGDNWLLPRHIN